MAQWRTEKGEIMDMKDMTDAHLRNCVPYCKRNGDWISLECVEFEIRRRLRERFYAQEKECPFCKGTMKPHKYVEEVIEVGMSPDIIEYRFTCDKCGSRGPELKFDEFSIDI